MINAESWPYVSVPTAPLYSLIITSATIKLTLTLLAENERWYNITFKNVEFKAGKHKEWNIKIKKWIN